MKISPSTFPFWRGKTNSSVCSNFSPLNYGLQLTSFHISSTILYCWIRSFFLSMLLVALYNPSNIRCNLFRFSANNMSSSAYKSYVHSRPKATHVPSNVIRSHTYLLLSTLNKGHYTFLSYSLHWNIPFVSFYIYFTYQPYLIQQPNHFFYKCSKIQTYKFCHALSNSTMIQ